MHLGNAKAARDALVFLFFYAERPYTSILKVVDYKKRRAKLLLVARVHKH